MDYKRIYDRLVEKRRENRIPDGQYRENHHVTPLSCGGSDAPDNIVSLSAREHLLAHKLLFRIYAASFELEKCKSMASAVCFLSSDPHRKLGRKHGVSGVKASLNSDLIRAGHVISGFARAAIPDAVKVFDQGLWLRVVNSVLDNPLSVKRNFGDFRRCCRLASMEIQYGTARFAGYGDFVSLLRTLSDF